MSLFGRLGCFSLLAILVTVGGPLFCAASTPSRSPLRGRSTKRVHWDKSTTKIRSFSGERNCDRTQRLFNVGGPWWAESADTRTPRVCTITPNYANLHLNAFPFLGKGKPTNLPPQKQINGTSEQEQGEIKKPFIASIFSASVSSEVHGKPRYLIFQRVDGTSNRRESVTIYPDRVNDNDPGDEDMEIGAFLKPGGRYFEYYTTDSKGERVNRLSGSTPIRHLDDWQKGKREIVLHYEFTRSSAVENVYLDPVANLTGELQALNVGPPYVGEQTDEQKWAALHNAKKYQASEDLVLQDIRSPAVDIKDAEDFLLNRFPFEDVRRKYRVMEPLVRIAPRLLEYATPDVEAALRLKELSRTCDVPGPDCVAGTYKTNVEAPKTPEAPALVRKERKKKRIFKGWE
ncbi:unnamed protein product [Amoebophrya sp. A120]|nr:unnamed protein product [Amoebophrya sp. A120]|eukprot:GSA120T00018571001.1